MRVKSEIMLMLLWGYHRVQTQQFELLNFEKFKTITDSTLHDDHKNIISKLLMFVVVKISKR